MTYEEFAAAAQRGAQALEHGNWDGAVAVFRALAESDLPDMDRSAMCVNIAIIHDQKGNTEGDVIRGQVLQ